MNMCLAFLCRTSALVHIHMFVPLAMYMCVTNSPKFLNHLFLLSLINILTCLLEFKKKKVMAFALAIKLS